MSQKRLRTLIGSLVGFLLLLLIQRLQVSLDQPASAPLSTTNTSSSAIVVAVEATSSTPLVPAAGLITTSTHFVANIHVLRVVDGDTVVIQRIGQSPEEKVRFLGINTPESVDPRRPVQCFGKEASHHLRDWIEGKDVYAAADPQADEYDKYGRLLRNIFIVDGGIDVNASMVAQGYAYAYTDFPQDKMRKRQLIQLQKEAQVGQRGLWNPSTCNGKK